MGFLLMYDITNQDSFYAVQDWWVISPSGSIKFIQFDTDIHTNCVCVCVCTGLVGTVLPWGSAFSLTCCCKIVLSHETAGMQGFSNTIYL